MSDTTCGAIFDMDGVLVDSTEAHYVAWHQFGQEVGKPFDRALFDKTFGMRNFEIIPLWLGDAVTDVDLLAMSDHKEELYRDAARGVLRPLPGVPELLGSLVSDRFLLAIGSSGPRPNVEMVLGILGARDQFQAMATLEDVSEGKPAPDVFLTAARKLGLPPAQCVVLEDAPQGVEAGLRAGSKVIAVTSTRDRSELGDAHLIVDSMTELSGRVLRGLIQNG